MLNNLPSLKADPLWGLLSDYQADSRANKVDLLVGVYRDETGQTPVMKVVQQAELFLANQSASKCYKQLSGNTAFNQQIAKFLLGAQNPKLETQYTIQTVGGSGALRVLADFIYSLSPNANVWNTNPGYINHQPIMETAGLTVKPFTWQGKGGLLDLDACLQDLTEAQKGDILLLHSSCHNPTGIDPSAEQWQTLISFCKSKGVIPLIDNAYQGFGDSVEEDAKALRLFVDQLDLVLVASSCSKNMGLYCERVGAAMIVTDKKEQLLDIKTALERITRANYSMPPNHGAEVATYLFNHSQTWFKELTLCRERVNTIRQQLDSRLNELDAPESLQIFKKQKGMFSLLPLTAEQMRQLREQFAIYGTDNGRVNLAGLQSNQISRLAEALISLTE